MVKAENLQIGHSLARDREVEVRYEVVAGDTRIEAPFSHRHQFYAVYWIHEGDGVHIIDFKDYAICAGRIFFIRPEQVHFFCANPGTRYSAIQFTEEFMSPFASWSRSDEWLLKISTCNDLNVAEQERLCLLFHQICAESVSGLPASAAVLRSEIGTLLLELGRVGGILDSGSVVLPDIVERFRKLIDEHYGSLHQVKEYARLLGVSPNYLNVLVQKTLGQSALDVINARLILEVKRLLLRTDDSISEIAFRMGFNELSYFSRFFKRYTGQTPHTFRITMNEMYQR